MTSCTCKILVGPSPDQTAPDVPAPSDPSQSQQDAGCPTREMLESPIPGGLYGMWGHGLVVD